MAFIHRKNLLVHGSQLCLCHKEPTRKKQNTELVLYGIKWLSPATLWSSQPMRVQCCRTLTNESGPGWLCISGKWRPSVSTRMCLAATAVIRTRIVYFFSIIIELVTRLWWLLLCRICFGIISFEFTISIHIIYQTPASVLQRIFEYLFLNIKLNQIKFLKNLVKKSPMTMI